LALLAGSPHFSGGKSSFSGPYQNQGVPGGPRGKVPIGEVRGAIAGGALLPLTLALSAIGNVWNNTRPMDLYCRVHKFRGIESMDSR